MTEPTHEYIPFSELSDGDLLRFAAAAIAGRERYGMDNRIELVKELERRAPLTTLPIRDFYRLSNGMLCRMVVGYQYFINDLPFDAPWAGAQNTSNCKDTPRWKLWLEYFFCGGINVRPGRRWPRATRKAAPPRAMPRTEPPRDE